MGIQPHKAAAISYEQATNVTWPSTKAELDVSERLVLDLIAACDAVRVALGLK